MPEFEYTARSASGQLKRGTLVTRDEVDLERKLQERNLVLTSSAVRRKKLKAGGWLTKFQSVPMVQRMFFTQYLHVMIRAGFSIARALDTLAQQTNSKYFRTVIHEIRSDVEAGISFSKSLAKHPRVFSELYVNMVAAGEASGKLDEVLERLAEKMKKDHGLIAKVKGALTYPIIIIIVMIAVAILMTVVVIPKLSEIFAESGSALPLATRILIGFSNFLVHHGWLAVIAVIVLLAGLLRLVHTARGRSSVDGLLLRTPIIGPIIQKISLARFSRSLSSLLQTSIPIIDAFSIISRTMGNTRYRQALEQTGNSLKTGSSIAKNMGQFPRLFPPLATQMISIGEESGSLDTIAGELATFYEDEVDQTMSNLSSIIEPILMLLLGLGVAGMAISVILPIYSLAQQIG
ncbi:MAG: type II secretion system F family protein [Candidatus Kerfeldbacteria bacterium]|nr:type II secretion system F family protein [Candidatus Kerfeldbacteria bacterium]